MVGEGGKYLKKEWLKTFHRWKKLLTQIFNKFSKSKAKERKKHKCTSYITIENQWQRKKY